MSPPEQARPANLSDPQTRAHRPRRLRSNTLNRKLRRDLFASWLLLSAIVGIIAVGVACYSSMASTFINLTEAKGRYYQQCRMADFNIRLKKAPVTELAPLAEMPGVTEIRSRIVLYATVDLDTSDEVLNGVVLSLPDRPEPVINDIVLRRGGYFTDRRENEVIVNEAFAQQHGLAPGDWIRLLLNNRRQELFIVGTAISSEFVYMMAPGALAPDPEHFGAFYLKQTYAEDVFDFDGAANNVVGRVAPEARSRLRDMLRKTETMLAPFGLFSATPLEDQPSNKILTLEMVGLKIFARFLPVIFLAVAALVLNMLLKRVAEQQRIVIGTLKAIGYSDGQIFLHLLKFGLAVGVLGGALGCALGYGMAAGMTSQYRTVFSFPDLRNAFYPRIHAFALLISLGCAVLGSLQGTRAVLKLRPAEAMRPKPPKSGRAILAERIGWFWSRLSADWRMVLRSLFRSRVRTLAGIFATAMGAAVLVAGFMMADAAHYMVDFQFRWVSRSDFDLAFKEERGEDALLEVARLPGVDRSEPVLNVACNFQNGSYRKRGAITGLAPDARLTVPRDSDAAAITMPAGGLVMTRKMAELLGLEQGDLVTVEPIKGHRRARRVRVLKIADSFLGVAVYADLHYLSRLVDEEFAISGVQLAADPDPDAEKALHRALKRLPAIEGVTARRAMVANLQKTMDESMGVFIGSLVLFAGAVFFGSILNSSLISLAERQREVATLCVLGYGPWRIGSLFLRESTITTLVGTLFGMPVGYLLSVGVSTVFDTEVYRFPVIATPSTWIWTFVLAIGFNLGAHLLVQRSVHKMNWLEALQAKE